MIKFFVVSIAISAAPVPVCILGVQYSIAMFFDLQNLVYSLELIAPPLSELIFSCIPFEFKSL